MILDQNQQSDAQLIGDIQNNKVGIDTNNLDFITSLLTTNLYSQPIQSFIRETVANGWDSHVEAGTTDKPVILRIYTDTREYIHIAVRDYGTGLSPERFNEIYLNIGASTKRTSNQYIGMFGLGRFSALAVSNTVHLTNYYQGTCNKFIMYKDAGKICIDKLFESTTEEENGLEVDVATDKQPHNCYGLCENITAGIRQLTFYNNIYIDDPKGLIEIDYSPIENFNTRKIAEFKTFKVCNFGNISNSLLMGNVLYPIEQSIIDKWFHGINSVPFAIKCDIGDVDITPSRETLLYSQKTINAIDKRCQETLKEIKEICKNNFGSDFKTIVDYYGFINNGAVYIDIKKFEDGVVDLRIPVSDLSYYDLSKNITISGQVPPANLLDYWKKLSYMNLPSNLILYDYCNERFHIKNNRLSIRRLIDYIIEDKVYLIDDPLKPVAKKYWNQNNSSEWNSYYFLYRKYIYSSFRRIIKEFCNSYNTSPTNKTLKFILEDFKRNYNNFKSYNNTDVPQDFINAFKAEKKQNKVVAQQTARKCVIYKLIDGRGWNTVGYDTDSYTLEKLACYKGTVFFAEKDNSYLEAFYRMIDKLDIKHTILVAVAPSNLPLLRNIKNCIELNRIFAEKNNIISKICTSIYLNEKWNVQGNSLYYIERDDAAFSKFYRVLQSVNKCTDLLSYAERNETIMQEFIKSLCTLYYKNNWLNYSIISDFETNKDYMKLNNWFLEGNTTKDTIFYLYEYITKHNISNKTRFDQIKNNLKPLFNEYTPNSELSHFNIG